MKINPPIEDELARLKTDYALLAAERDRLRQHLLSITATWDAVLEKETKTIARELHDDLGQLLTALRMDISLFRLQYQEDGILVDKADGMLALTDRCMQAVCRLLATLRSSGLDQGLAVALEQLCVDFSHRRGHPCTLSVSLDCNALDAARTVILFHILREALSNIAAHAGPCSTHVTLGKTADAGLHVEIRDNGYGFDPAEITPTKSVGLRLMRESAFVLGGTLDITSKKNVGTTITLHIPYSPAIA